MLIKTYHAWWIMVIKFAYLSLSFSFREIPVEKGFLDLTTQEDRCVIHFFHEDFRRCAIMDTHLEVIIQECPQKCPIFFMYEFQWIKLMHTLIEVTLMINFYFIPRITVILFIFMGIMKYWGHYVHVHIYTCLCVKIALEISFVSCSRICNSYGISLQILIIYFCRLWQRNILKPSLPRSMLTKPSTLWRSSRFVCYQQCCVSRMEWL